MKTLCSWQCFHFQITYLNKQLMLFQLEADLQERISKDNATMADNGRCGLWFGHTAWGCCTEEPNGAETVTIGKQGVENPTMTTETNAL